METLCNLREQHDGRHTDCAVVGRGGRSTSSVPIDARRQRRERLLSFDRVQPHYAFSELGCFVDKPVPAASATMFGDEHDAMVGAQKCGLLFATHWF